MTGIQQALSNLMLIENTLRGDPRCTGENGAPLSCLRDVRATLDAVAELIEADKEYDAARRSQHCVRLGEVASRRHAALNRLEGIAA